MVVIKTTINGFMWLALPGINLIYACTYICMKMASFNAFLSNPFILWTIGAIGIMGIYAFLWQQVLTRIPLSIAYMFKGTSIVFVLLLSYFLFDEGITLANIIGSIIIVIGICFYAQT